MKDDGRRGKGYQGKGSDRVKDPGGGGRYLELGVSLCWAERTGGVQQERRLGIQTLSRGPQGVTPCGGWYLVGNKTGRSKDPSLSSVMDTGDSQRSRGNRLEAIATIQAGDAASLN